MRPRAVLLAIFLGCGVFSPAWAADAAEIVTAVEDKYDDVECLQASFVQTTKSDVFGEEKQRGQVVLKRPSKMRWDFTDGVEKQFITDGQTMWVYTKADNQVIRYDDVSASSSVADSLLQSLDRLDELFDVTLVESTALQHVLELKPKQEAQFQKMRLVLDGGYVVKSVTITDSFGGVTELVFTDVKLDVKVPDAHFTFDPPPGVEVISAGSM